MPAKDQKSELVEEPREDIFRCRLRLARNRHLMKVVGAMTRFAIIAILMAMCGVFVFLLVDTSTKRTLTTLESTLFQILILGTGVAASYRFSQSSAKVAAEQLIKPHARSAFRRMNNLYGSLFDVKRIIRLHKESKGTNPNHVIEIVEAIVDQQVKTVVDAMEDWRDIIPEDVADIERQLQGHDITETETLRR